MIEAYPKQLLSSITGMVLGDASLQKHGRQIRLTMCHCEAQREYLLRKREILQPLWEPEIYVREYVNNGGHPSLELKTRGHALLSELYETIYDAETRKRKITAGLLDTMGSDQLYAIWFADDGSFNQRKEALIWCTDRYSYEEQAILCAAVNAKYDAQFSIQRTNNNHYRLYCSLKKSGSFTHLLYAKVPQCMQYKFNR